MNIFYDDEIFCRQKFGGISRYYVELIKFMKSHENVRCGAFFHKNHYLKKDLNQINFKLPDFKYSYHIFKNLNKKLKLSLTDTSTPNIYHYTYYKGRSIRSRKNTYFCTVHDLIEEILLKEQYCSRDVQIFYKKDTFTYCDHIISVSEHTKQRLCEFYEIEPHKVTVVHHGIDHSVFNIGPSGVGHASIDQKPSVDGPFILYVGNRSGYKNFNRLLAAFSSSPKLQSQVKLVTFGGERFSREELRLISSLKLCESSVVHLTGSDETLAKLYQAAVCMVYPSLLEGFGMPPLEAMACGCPVAVSDASSIPEVVGDAGLYFSPESPEEMANKLELLVFDTSVSSAMRKMGLARAKEFNWQKCGAKTLSVYRDIAC